MRKKLKAIWHEIIERWILLKLFPTRMERERLQVLAELVKRKDTLWKNIPMKPRTLSEILSYKELKKKNTTEMIEDGDIKMSESSPQMHWVYQEIFNKVKEKENGEQQETKRS